MESLPLDIVQDILSRVPAESVLECKLVCKSWGTLIHGTNFASMHLSHQLNQLYDSDDNDVDDNLAAKVESSLFFSCRIDDPDEDTALLFHGGQPSDRISIGDKYIYEKNLKRIYHPPMHTNFLYDHLVGSCNGLVCAYQIHHLVLDPIYICNPLTREYVHLPQLVVKPEDVRLDCPRVMGGDVDMFYSLACGFGYVRSTNEYKVVRIRYIDYEEGEVEVYTLGSGRGWRALGSVPYRLNSVTSTGTYANDCIFWIWEKTVVAFDLADEKFGFISPAPPCLSNGLKVEDKGGLVALGRHLCLYINKLRMEIWLLTESSDAKETWRMAFDIDYEAVVGSPKGYFEPILLTKNGEIIFLYAESVLYSYDMRTTCLKMISDNPIRDDCFEDVEAIAHLNTFASLEGMGENSRRHAVQPSRGRIPCDGVINELDRVTLSDDTDTTPFRFM